jgi:hypothetical protein
LKDHAYVWRATDGRAITLTPGIAKLFSNNDFKWKYADVGMYDNNSIMYRSFDSRVGVAALTGTPQGDFDDMYSIPFDLTGFDGKPCNLNFFYSGASRTASSEHINDTLFIDYSIDKKHAWTNIKKLTKGDLLNKGVISTEYTPSICFISA